MNVCHKSNLLLLGTTNEQKQLPPNYCLVDKNAGTKLSATGMAEGGDSSSSRNFRSAYYEKLGFCENEEENILDLLIASSPFDLEKLSDLCERFDLDRRCVEAWKVLLGVECNRKNPFDDFANVRQVRTEHFQSLKHHLEVLLRHNVVIQNRLKKCSKSPPPPPPPSSSSSTTTTITFDPKPLDDPGMLITLMYLLEAGRLDSSDICAQLESSYCRKLSAMALFFVNVSNDLQEAFFLFRNFTRKLEENEALEKSQLNNVKT